MPTQTFLNLPKQKQQILISAARLEFQEHTLMDSSINKIIRDASIPRGSFYQYFEDKEDLYFYVLKLDKEKLDEGLENAIEQAKDLEEIFIKAYDFLYAYIIQSNNEKYFKNLILTIQKLESKQKEKKHPFDHIIFNKIETKIKTNPETLEDLFDMISILLGKMIIESLKNKEQHNYFRERFITILNIITNGLEKYEESEI